MSQGIGDRGQGIGGDDLSVSRDAARLRWVDGRWHLGGRPIHAGMAMELLCADGYWLPVRIESRHAGRALLAFFRYHGMDLCCHAVDMEGRELHSLRWPQKGGA